MNKIRGIPRSDCKHKAKCDILSYYHCLNYCIERKLNTCKFIKKPKSKLSLISTPNGSFFIKGTRVEGENVVVSSKVNSKKETLPSKKRRGKV